MVNDDAEFPSYSHVSLSRAQKLASFGKLSRTPDNAFHNIVHHLNAPTSMLKVSRFELRLLNFFSIYCIPLFSQSIDPESQYVWTREVPQLSLESTLVRNSIYSFAAMCLIEICNLPEIQHEDNKEASPYATSLINPNVALGNDSLYAATSRYFMDTIVATREKVDDLANYRVASELAVSSIVMYAFLGIHPHKLVTLVCFDQDDTDFISMARGIRETVRRSWPVLADTNFRGLFAASIRRNDPLETLPFEKCYPVVQRLGQELLAANPPGCEYLTEAVMWFQRLITLVIRTNHPADIVKWIALVPVEVCHMIYDRGFHGLRLLYVYSCYCAITRFYAFEHSNMWHDYIEWYRRHNFDTFGRWFYDYDESFYIMTVEKSYGLNTVDYSPMGALDPELLARTL